MWWIFIVVGAILLLIVLFFVFLATTKICEGGALFSGCGKALYPWTKKFKLPTGLYCCAKCYARDLEQFAKMKAPETDKTKPRFTVEEETFDLGEDDETGNDT